MTEMVLTYENLTVAYLNACSLSIRFLTFSLCNSCMNEDRSEALKVHE